MKHKNDIKPIQGFFTKKTQLVFIFTCYIQDIVLKINFNKPRFLRYKKVKNLYWAINKYTFIFDFINFRNTPYNIEDNFCTIKYNNKVTLKYSIYKNTNFSVRILQ